MQRLAKRRAGVRLVEFRPEQANQSIPSREGPRGSQRQARQERDDL
jgi:hypothetical protein